MFKLTYMFFDKIYETELETKEEILSLAMDVFEKNGQLLEIYEDSKLILSHSEIYQVLGKVYY